MEIGTNDEYDNQVKKYAIQRGLDINENTLINDKRIVHQFDCDSGIYVSKFIFESFRLDNNKNIEK